VFKSAWPVSEQFLLNEHRELELICL